MQIQVANSFAEFVRYTDNLDLFSDFYIFRGQAKQGGLVPSIARKNPATDTTATEKQVLEQLALLGASLLGQPNIAQLDLLVMAQHHGLRTRLLDWSTNPLAALWFACADSAKGDTFVYALDATKLLRRDIHAVDPFALRKTAVFQPRFNNPRIVAQDGWFTLHMYAPKPRKFVALEKNPTVKPHLTEVRIPEARRPEIIDSLRRHGVSSKTLFPDLVGLCQHLNAAHKLG